MRKSKTKKSGRKNSRTTHRGSTFLAVLGAVGLGCLLAGWNANSSQVPDLSPAEVVALRFPDARNDVFDEVADARAETVGSVDTDDQPFNLFSPYPTMAPSEATAAPATYVTASLSSTPVEIALPAPARDIRPKAEPKVVAVHSKPAAAPRSPGRPGAVLSDSQIANIKTRLNLTPDQQEMWPAVERALRSLAYAKSDERPRGGGSAATRTATLDPGSDEVQHLKSAAFPLIMSFSDEQKRELRILAHVAGLEKLASQF
jgi:hypothetical protein